MSAPVDNEDEETSEYQAMVGEIIAVAWIFFACFTGIVLLAGK